MSAPRSQNAPSSALLLPSPRRTSPAFAPRRLPTALLHVAALLAVTALAGLVALVRPARAMEVTAITLHACDATGSLDASHRFNTGPVDGAWDLFVYRGEASDPRRDDPSGVAWLNRADDHTVRLPLSLGKNTFTFHHDGAGVAAMYGLNLFFDGRNDRPEISLMAEVDRDGAPYPEFAANSAAVTMGWPLTEVPGAGTLTWDGAGAGLWNRAGSGVGLRATVTEFHLTAPEATGVDLVGPHALGPSGEPDFVGRLTIEVSELTVRPPEVLLWLEGVAGVTALGGGLAEAWKAAARSELADPPFSWSSGGRPARDALKGWKRSAQRRPLDGGRVAHTVSWVDPETGLTVRWEAVEYADFSTVEWTLHLENAGSTDTAILSDIRPLDLRLERPSRGEFLLHHAVGSPATKDDFRPLETALGPGAKVELSGAGGRPSNKDWPYVDLEYGGDGLVIAVGWPGQWAARFVRDAARGLDIQAGQELTRFRLRPGEAVRTPRIVLQSWSGGDWIDAQNRWRRWMVAHVLPRPGGRLPPPQLAGASSHYFAEMAHATEESQIQFIDRYLEEGIRLDYWWMDAGWYPCDGVGWPKVGTWEVDPRRFPRGLRAVSDHAHSRGVKTIVWFEPERVAAGTWLADEHPEWVLGGAGGGLLDLGNPEARRWLTEHVDRLITEEGIDLYRQDFNMDPLGHWRGNDAEDRQGITEIRHVEGYLAYWDALIARHPAMLLDTCASGGRRDDLETLRRSVPLHRSDYILEPTGVQCHSYGISLWLPFSGAGAKEISPYAFRSNMHPAIVANWDARDPSLDYALLRKLVGEWREVSASYYGDYYPLTPYTQAEDAWMAWQFHRPADGEGFVQAFRRAECLYFGLQVRLRGLDRDATYELRDVDRPGNVEMTGKHLMERGLPVEIQDQPGAALIIYKVRRQG